MKTRMRRDEDEKEGIEGMWRKTKKEDRRGGGRTGKRRYKKEQRGNMGDQKENEDEEGWG